MKKILIVAVLMVFVCFSHASATPITEPDQIVPQTLIDFNGLSSPVSPLVISGVTFTGILSVIDTDLYSASTTYPTYVSEEALGIPRTSLPYFRIAFDSPVAQIGFGLFDPNFEGNMIHAYDGGGTLLESTAPDFLDIPGGSAADYVGFSRVSPDIKWIEIVPSGTPSTDAMWIDNVAFSTSPIPEPTTMLLLGFGLIGLASARRKINA